MTDMTEECLSVFSRWRLIEVGEENIWEAKAGFDVHRRLQQPIRSMFHLLDLDQDVSF